MRLFLDAGDEAHALGGKRIETSLIGDHPRDADGCDRREDLAQQSTLGVIGTRTDVEDELVSAIFSFLGELTENEPDQGVVFGQAVADQDQDQGLTQETNSFWENRPE